MLPDLNPNAPPVLISCPSPHLHQDAGSRQLGAGAVWEGENHNLTHLHRAVHVRQVKHIDDRLACKSNAGCSPALDSWSPKLSLSYVD